MRQIVLVAALLAACKAPDAPSGYGVDLHIKADALDGAKRAAIKQANVQVTGDETYSTIVDVSKLIQSGEVRVRYVPGVVGGMLNFQIDALAADGTVVASGLAVAVPLVAGKAVEVVVYLGAPYVASTSTDMAVPSMLKGKGEPCADSTECGSPGICADGVCCDRMCTTSCEACNAAGSVGTCGPVAAGSLPADGHPGCGGNDPSTCMLDGNCDGKGSCRRWPAGTACGASACAHSNSDAGVPDGGTRVGDVFTPSPQCDGNGNCLPQNPTTCDPFLCKDNKVCVSMCTGKSDCAGINDCSAGYCGSKPNGIACGGAVECKSGFCVDGVCCDTACTDACTYCKLPASPGKCSPVPNGADPRNVCPVGTAGDANCKPGGCNGSGGCIVAASGTPCAARCQTTTPVTTKCDAFGKCNQDTLGSSCSGSMCKVCLVAGTSAACTDASDGASCADPYCSGDDLFLASTCKGGSCQMQQKTSCLPYKCNVANKTCFTNCCNDTYLSSCYSNTPGTYNDTTKCGTAKTCTYTSGTPYCNAYPNEWCCE